MAWGRVATVLVTAALWSAGALGAQVPVRRDTTVRVPIPSRDAVRRDTLTQGADTTRPKRVLVWDPADSVMNALLSRRGYAVTRYQGATVIFRAGQHEINLRGKPSMVSRDSATLVGDTITFNDSTQIAIAIGDTLLLRDPGQSVDDIVARRLLRYDARTKEALVRDVTTSIESGQVWVVHGDIGAFKGDTTENGASAFYARGGTLTSCTLTTPHYHFAAKEMKLITKNVMVARPAILYIADIPVFWLPFVFQDMRSGRRSGLIPPRFGFSELVRNSPSYRRTIDDFGYYFAISDYLDAQVTMDWRSDARSTATDPGWIKLNGRFNYKIRDRFINGNLGVSHHYLKNGTTNDQYSLVHDQDFSQRTHLSANLNYVTNTTVQKNTTFNPYAALQIISSALNFRTGRGPLSVNVGGTQQQYPGRDEIRRTFPTLSITSTPIRAGDWLTWTPSISATNNQAMHIDQVGDFGYRYVQNANGTVDSVKLDRSTRNSSIRFDTPLEIFGFSWRNQFSITDDLQDFPIKKLVVDVNDTSKKELRVYKRSYATNLNWETSFSLPSFSQGKWNLTPSVQFQKVDGRSGLIARTERTGNKFVSQPLRTSIGLGISPTFYRQFPGIGPVERIRHSVSTVISYAYSPKVSVSDEFLAAFGDTRVGYLGDRQQNLVSLSLSSVFEAKLRQSKDTLAGVLPAQKIKLLALNFTALSYDFERAKVTKSTGLTNRNFGYTARSDLLPGLDFGVDYSLFQGDPISDTATFKPYREAVRGTLSLGANSPLVRGLGRLLGFRSTDGRTTKPPGQSPSAPPVTPPQFVAGQPIAGSVSRATMSIPRGQGWSLNLTYSAQRQRPPRGSNVADIDVDNICGVYKTVDPFGYDNCVRQQASATATNGSFFGNETTRGGTYFRTPAQSNAQSSMSFHITEKWAAQWSTTYDFQRKQFASQVVSLQREMHDWDAVFAFTRAPNGNFAFNFFIALKAEPDIKFNYDRRDYPRGYTGPRRQ